MSIPFSNLVIKRLVLESNPRPLAPEARIIPLDQQAFYIYSRYSLHRLVQHLCSYMLIRRFNFRG